MITTREATPGDADNIARLHAESWRASFRGIFEDAYLDGPVVEDRLTTWRARFDPPAENQFVLLAEEEGELIGFACVYGADDPTWGSLLDNLHVDPAHQSKGIGGKLMVEVATWCRAHYPDAGLYLWVLDENKGAQRFYARLGAKDEGGDAAMPGPGGPVHGRRYAWATVPELGRG